MMESKQFIVAEKWNAGKMEYWVYNWIMSISYQNIKLDSFRFYNPTFQHSKVL